MATLAAAQVTNVRIVARPTDPVLPDHYVHQMLIDFTGQYTGTQMIVELESGSIYQDPSPMIQPGFQPPVAALLALTPTARFDTFVANGGATADRNVTGFGLGGGGTRFDLGPVARFDTQVINQSWNPASGSPPIVDRVDFLVAQVTLSRDASGRFGFVAFAGFFPSDRQVFIDTTITDGLISGAVLIPEPTTLALLAATLTGMLRSLKAIRATKWR